MTLVCYDSVNPANLPAGADAYAVYVDGRYVNETAVRARFPAAHLITIAANAAHDAMCLDVERGDAYPSQAPAWVRRQLGRGAYRPVLYASTYLMPTVLAALTSAGISRDTVRVWSAHYVATRHICSPATCHAPFTADGTQWAGSPGNSPGPYDISVLNSTFFDPPVEADMTPADLTAALDQYFANGEGNPKTGRIVQAIQSEIPAIAAAVAQALPAQQPQAVVTGLTAAQVEAAVEAGVRKVLGSLG